MASRYIYFLILYIEIRYWFYFQRNYRFYLMFMTSALCFCIYIFAFCCRRIHRKLQHGGIGLLGVLKNCPETLALASFLFACIGFLGGLLSFHIYLILINQVNIHFTFIFMCLIIFFFLFYIHLELQTW